MMNNYVVERADGYKYAVESDLSGEELLAQLRAKYQANSSSFSTFSPHINRIPVAVYVKVAEQGRNEE